MPTLPYIYVDSAYICRHTLSMTLLYIKQKIRGRAKIELSDVAELSIGRRQFDCRQQLFRHRL